jgi:outer membrane lipoprotein-sorting protein
MASQLSHSGVVSWEAMNTSPVPPPPAVSRQRARWLIPPAVAFTLIAGFGFGPGLIGAGADVAPILPAVTAQDLVAKVMSSTPPAFSGTVQTKTNLGLPSLGSVIPNGSGLLSTLLTPHTITVAGAPDGKFHVAIPDGLTETDLVSDGTQLWVWESGTQSVTHLAQRSDTADTPGATDAHEPAGTVEPTPDAVAKKLLADADPTTRVFVRGTATVAGQDAYELVLAPKSSTTLVADVVLDIDAVTSMPLRAQILAKDAGTPALDIGFTSIDYRAQPDSAFTFTAPPGAKVTEATSPDQLVLGPPRPHDGQGRHRKGAGAGTDPAASIVSPTTPPTAPPAAETRTLGTGWDTVVAIPNGPAQLGGIGRPVSGAWGSGKLVTSTVVDALVLDDGTVLVGMVGPERLEAAVAELRAHP